MNDIKTILAQAGHYINRTSGGIVPPIDPSATFARDENLDLMGQYLYSRYQNPSHDQLEHVMCQLENGSSAKFFSSGLAAIAAVFETVRPGEHIVAPQVMYHGAQDWLRRIAERRGIGLEFFSPGEINSIKEAVVPDRTNIVWIESPVNPSFDVIDIKKTAEIAHAAGAILGVDATCAPPVTTRAFDFGADLVVHSATKYLNGHSDLNAGVIITQREDDRWQEILTTRTHSGAILGSFDAWLLLRGMRTMAIRFERASENAMQIAQFLESHEKVETVMYPGLRSHPTHTVAARQMKNGFGGMMSILMKGGGEAAHKLAASVKVFVRATSLGGVESLIEHRRTVEGPNSKVPIQLLRISVGIEDVNDLIEDLSQALDQV